MQKHEIYEYFISHIKYMSIEQRSVIYSIELASILTTRLVNIKVTA